MTKPKTGERPPCEICGASVPTWQRNVCPGACERVRAAARQRAWSEAHPGEAKAAVRKYAASSKGKAWVEAHATSALEASARYRASPKRKPVVAKYRASPKGIETDRRSVRNRRARKLAVVSVPYSNVEIADRDKWTCSLCGQRIPKNKKFPDLTAMTIDHVVPLSLGGDDAPHNVRVAHYRCNSKKNNRVAGSGEQLMLVG